MAQVVRPVVLDEGVFAQYPSTFAHLRVKQSATFDDIYWPKSGLQPRLQRWFNGILKGRHDSMLRLSHYITFHADAAVRASAHDAAWVSVRTLGGVSFTGPRWHSDGQLFNQPVGFKRAATFVGPPTRFGVVRNRRQFDDVERLLASATDVSESKLLQSRLNELVFEIPPLPKSGPFVDFRFGENGTIHSEPDIRPHESRIFCSIVPGPQAAIETWLRK